MFRSMQELFEAAEDYESIAELMIEKEVQHGGHPRQKIVAAMEENLKIMKKSVEKGVRGVTSVTGLTGGDAKKIAEYRTTGQSLSGDLILTAVQNAIATNEVNAAMGLICATPTAGSAGVLAGVLTAASPKLQMTQADEVNFLFTAGAIGLVIANRGTISGAEGGCQAEVGSASAMAAGALVIAAGGSLAAAGEAVAITLKNMMGLICDPVAGLVEVPCVKRNALGASQALVSADLALAGVTSRIPVDEVIEAMYRVGQQLPSIFKETAEGGLAMTPTGKRIATKLKKRGAE